MLVLAIFCCLYVSHFQEFSYFKAQSSRRDNQKESQHVSSWTSLYRRGQDWFALSNFLGLGSTGVYVDVGASLPFDYSNTATGQQHNMQMPRPAMHQTVPMACSLRSCWIGAWGGRAFAWSQTLISAFCWMSIAPVKSLRCWTEV